jgi:hypothetical protein
MRSCGFAPREAMGWLRIVRPGCVIGEQQHFLCNYAPAVARNPSAGASAATTSCPVALRRDRTAAALAAQVSSGMERRCAPAVRSGRNAPCSLAGSG